MKPPILLAILIAFLAPPLAGLHAAGNFDGTWLVTITDGTFHLSDGSSQPYSGSPGTITVKNGKVGGNTYGGKTSYSGTVTPSGAAKFTINVAGLSIQNYVGKFSKGIATGTFDETRPGMGTASGHWKATLTNENPGGGGGGGGGPKPDKDPNKIQTAWYFFTTTTHQPDDDGASADGYAYIERIKGGGRIKAVFIPGLGSLTDPVAQAIEQSMLSTYFSPLPPLIEAVFQWPPVALNPGTVFSVRDTSGNSYGFQGTLSWVSNSTAGDNDIGTPRAASWPIGTVSGWDGFSPVIFARSGSGMLTTTFQGNTGNFFILTYYPTKFAPPAGSLALGGSSAPSASAIKAEYHARGSSATIAGHADGWPFKLKIHATLSGGTVHPKLTSSGWRARLVLPRMGKYVLTTWFTDASGLRGAKVRTVIFRDK